jgi:hypothetical protein
LRIRPMRATTKEVSAIAESRFVREAWNWQSKSAIVICTAVCPREGESCVSIGKPPCELCLEIECLRSCIEAVNQSMRARGAAEIGEHPVGLVPANGMVPGLCNGNEAHESWDRSVAAGEIMTVGEPDRVGVRPRAKMALRRGRDVFKNRRAPYSSLNSGHGTPPCMSLIPFNE